MTNHEEPVHITIKKLMVEKDIRQKTLARRLRRDRALITRALQGKAPKTLRRIGRLFGIRVAAYQRKAAD
jgi:plasmid maintenance system antidote protein VapI